MTTTTVKKFSSQQETLFQTFTETNQNIVVAATAGCLGLGTKVLMFDGSIKTVENIVVGDFVMGPDSKPRCVLNVASGRSNLYKIVPKKGDPWICNDTHIITAHKETLATALKKKGKEAWESALVDLPINFFLTAKKISLSRNVKGTSIQGYRLRRVPLSFKSAPIEQNIDPYIVGLWLGDGATKDSIVWSIDQEIIQYLQDNAQCTIAPDPTTPTVSRIRLKAKSDGDGENTYRRYFKKKCNNEQGEKIIPQELLINDKNVRLKLLAGIIDTDGFLDKNCCVQILQKRKKLSEQIAFLAQSLGFAATLKPVKRKAQTGVEGTYWQVYISGEIDEIPTILPRKKPQPRKQIKNALNVGFTIEDIGVGDWFGFTVDRDHRFLLHDCTICHNSGKSTSLLHLLNLIPVYKKSVFVAFSNAIAAELKERVPKHSKASTFHSLGLGCIRTTFGFDSVVVNPNKVRDYVKERLAKQTFNNPKKWYKKWMDLIDIIEVCRLHHLTEIEQLLDKDLEFKMDIILEGFQLHMELLSSDQSKYPTKSDPLIVDFSAMVFMPALDPRIRVDKYDVVCVDECQDLTPITREFVLKLIAPNGRFVAVGDKFQAIFGFMGSDAESFSKLEAIPNTITLPLSTTYRCGKLIAKFAQRFSPDIIPFEQNEDGEIYDGSILDAESGDIILCRTNKPLVKAYLEMLQEKVPCSIKDKDFGDKLMKIIKKYFDPLHPTQLRFTLQKRAEEILQELQKLGVALPHAHPKYINFLELCEIVKLLVKAWGYKNLLADVEKMFNQSNGGATLMSIHKSKGLEADRVFIIRWDLCPHNRAVTSTEIEQEKHLQFVAVTRAKKELVFDHNAGRDDNVEEFIF